MVDCLRFTDLTAAQLETLQGVTEAEECKDLLEKYIGTGSRKDSPATSVIVDFHFYNLAFCRQSGFSPDKVSTFCSIMKQVLTSDMSAVHRRCEHSFEMLKGLILKHSVWRPPRSEGVFSKEDVQKIATYVTTSYYRHFSLYRAVLAKRAQLFLEQKAPGFVEQPKIPAPLDDGMEVVGGIDDVALTDEENALVEKFVAQNMAASRADYESKKNEISAKLAELEEPSPEEEEQ